jgi:hypothetical protein
MGSEAMSKLWWISWNQNADPKHGLDCRPVKWPPPINVLAFWESGFAADESYCTVVALVRAPDADAAARTIKKAWAPGIGTLRFNREYDEDRPPGDRFPAPDWSIKMRRWPWKVTP